MKAVPGFGGEVGCDDGDGFFDHGGVNGGHDFDFGFAGGKDRGGVLFEGRRLEPGAHFANGVAVTNFAAEKGIGSDEKDRISQFASPVCGRRG